MNFGYYEYPNFYEDPLYDDGGIDLKKTELKIHEVSF